MEDRISVLPDAVIHNIFSFMRIRSVIHTSILSNRWRHLWLSTPSLKFKYDRIYCNCQNSLGDNLSRCSLCKEERIRHVNFVNRVLITRQSNLVKFRISDGIDVDANHILTWIIGALGLHAQEIVLRCVYVDSLKLPYHLFNPNIRVLELDFPGELIRLPNSFSRATRLTSLDLRNVRFPDGNDDGEFILSCPVLENLKMDECDLSNLKVLTVSTPLIERLDCYCLYTMDNVSCKVKTSAPTLRSLNVAITSPKDCRSVDFCLDDLVSLVRASVSGFSSRGYGYLAEHCAQPLIEVFTGIYNVQALKIQDLLLRVIAEIPESLERLPKLFQNLRSLMLTDEYLYDDVPKKVQKMQEAVIFLERLPHIETLVWERTLRDRRLEDEDWVASMQSQCIFSRLKSFEYRNFLGSDAEQNFLEFLLERATVLKELIIKTPRLSSLYGKLTPFKEKSASLSLYGDKLLSLPRASSRVTISYQLRS